MEDKEFKFEECEITFDGKKLEGFVPMKDLLFEVKPKSPSMLWYSSLTIHEKINTKSVFKLLTGIDFNFKAFNNFC